MSAENPSALSADDARAVQGVPARIVAAWANNDADAFAEVFTEDGSLILPGDVFLKSREEIRTFMAAAFSGPFKGTQVTGTPLAVKSLADGVAQVVTYGGVIASDESELSPRSAIRASWLLTRTGSTWSITHYQNTPVAPSTK
jgi:uncharacterized protein (TIGR02246 family)